MSSPLDFSTSLTPRPVGDPGNLVAFPSAALSSAAPTDLATLREKSESNPLLPPTISAAELSRKVCPPQRWIVPGFLPEGVTMLAGAPKSGKSWLALHLAISVAAGKDFAGLGQPEQTGVLYIALEDSERRLQDRQAGLFDGAMPACLHYALTWKSFDQGGLDELDAWLNAHPDVRLVIVDVFALVRKQSQGNKNIYDQDYAAIRDVKRLADGRRLAVILVHHTNKGDGDDVLKSVSGSTGLTAAVDAVMVLAREKDSQAADLWITGRDVENDALRMMFEGGRWSYAGPARKQLAPTRQAIINGMVQAGRPLSPAEIADQTGLGHDLVKKTVQRMQTDGNLVRTGHGLYALLDRPRLPPESHPSRTAA